MKVKRSIGLAAILAMVGTAQATLLVYEGFEYETTSGGLWSGTGNTGLNGGTGFASEWFVTDTSGTANWNITAGSPTWGSLIVSSNQLFRTSGGGTEEMSRPVSADLDGASDLWFSIIWKGGDNAAFAIGGGPFANDTSTALSSGPGFGFLNRDYNLPVTDKGIRVAVWNDSGTLTANGDLGLARGDTVLLVGHVSFNTGTAGADVYKLYSVGADLALPATPIATLEVDGTEANLTTVAQNTNRQPGMDELRIGTTYADVVPASAAFSFNLTPADQLNIAVDYPATLATNDIVTDYANSTLGVEIMALNVTGTSNAFSAVTATPFTNSTPTPAMTSMEFEFDASAVKTISGTTGGFNVDGSVDVIWRNLDGGAVTTNTVALKGNYSNPAFQFSIDSSLGLTLEAPATVVSNEIAVSYVEGRPGHTNVEIVAVNVLNEQHAGAFSAINPGVIQNPEPSNSVITVIFDNAFAGLGNKESSTCNVEVVYGEVGGSVDYTNTVPVSAFNYDLPGDAVVQQVFGNSVDVNLGVGSQKLPMNNFGAYTNKWNANQNLVLDQSEGTIKLTSGSNTRSAYNLIEANTAGSDNFGAVDTHILTNGLYRYDFDYEVLNTEGANTIWSFNAYALIDQQDFPPSNNNHKVLLDVATGTTGGVDVDIENDGNAYYSQHADGTLGGTSNVARTTGSVYLNVQDDQDALFVMHRSGKCTVRLYDLVLTRIGDAEEPAGYSAWAKDKGLTEGVNDGLEDDPDLDGLSNLMEYALDGDPLVDDAATVAPQSSVLGGYFYHVYKERTDDPTLTFTVDLNDNLTIPGGWGSAGLEAEERGTDDGTWQMVTNSTDTAEAAEFIRLQVEKD